VVRLEKLLGIEQPDSKRERKMEPEKAAQLYLSTLNKLQITPNFWMSLEYILKAGLAWVEDYPLQGFKLPEAVDRNEWFFPPLNMLTGGLKVGKGYWYAGFIAPPYLVPNETLKKLDDQFIYNPADFLEMKGGCWAVFRKNVKKFPKRNPGWLLYRPIERNEEGQVRRLALDWGENKQYVYDVEVFLEYMLEGWNRRGLFYKDKLVGMNIWDENYRYINYRFCVDIGEPFLNEHLRWRFYTSPLILNRKKWVNDGGSLSSPNLRKFKMKLNPTVIYEVHSYTDEHCSKLRRIKNEE
jgi:hypothetical protein